MSTTTPCAENALPYAQQVKLLEEDPRTLVPDDWYTRPSAGEGTDEARRLRWAKDACRLDCPGDVRVQCLKLSLDNREEYGVWGGYDERERAQLLTEIDRRRAHSGSRT